MVIPMLKMRRSWERIIFNMGIPILVRRHIYIEMAPAFHYNLSHILIVKYTIFSGYFLTCGTELINADLTPQSTLIWKPKQPTFLVETLKVILRTVKYKRRKHKSLLTRLREYSVSRKLCSSEQFFKILFNKSHGHIFGAWMNSLKGFVPM